MILVTVKGMPYDNETFQGYRHRVLTSRLRRFGEIPVNTVVVENYRVLGVITGRMINRQSHDDVGGEADLVLVVIDRWRPGNEHEQCPSAGGRQLSTPEVGNECAHVSKIVRHGA